MAPEPTKAAERRLTARGRERRASLLAYSIERFAQNGYHPTSVADIVEGVGVGKGVFYWYFESKDQLLLEIMAESLLDLRRAQQAAINNEPDALARLEKGIRTSIQWAADHREIMRLVMFCWTEAPFSDAVQRGREISITDAARHVRQAISDGQIPEGNAVILATAIRGVTDEIGRELAIGNEPVTDELVETAVRFCLYGLGGSAPAGSTSAGSAP